MDAVGCENISKWVFHPHAYRHLLPLARVWRSAYVCGLFTAFPAVCSYEQSGPKIPCFSASNITSPFRPAFSVSESLRPAHRASYPAATFRVWGVLPSFGKARADGVGGGRGPRRHAELAKNVLEVPGDGLFADAEAGSGALVGQTFGDKF